MKIKKNTLILITSTVIVGTGITMFVSHNAKTGNSTIAYAGANNSNTDTDATTNTTGNFWGQATIATTNSNKNSNKSSNKPANVDDKTTTSDTKEPTNPTNPVIPISPTEPNSPVAPTTSHLNAPVASGLTTPIVQTPPVSTIANPNYKEFFSKDVFMGDSITDALSNYEFLDDANVCAKIGVNINNAKDTIPSITIKNPKNIFLLYGVNDMSDTMPSEWFVNSYKTLVNKVKQSFPNSNIYIQSILPVDPIAEKQNAHINNTHINQCNAGLITMAKEENITYLDIASVLNSDNSATIHEQDGIHFKLPFYILWLNYLEMNVK